MAKLAAKPVRASLTQLSDLMYPTDANFRGTVFGGVILALVDKAAAVCAMRHAGQSCVTVAMDRVEFLVPINVGDLVIAEAQVNYVGRSSVEVGVEVYAENITTNERRHTNSCLVTMVAVGKDNKPTEVPGLTLETKEEKGRWASAEKRRKARHS